MNEIDQYKKLLNPIQDAAHQFFEFREHLRGQLAPVVELQRQLNRTLGPTLEQIQQLKVQVTPYLMAYQALVTELVKPAAAAASVVAEHLRAHENEIRHVVENLAALSATPTIVPPLLPVEPSDQLSRKEFDDLRFEMSLNEASIQARLAKAEDELAQVKKLLAKKSGPGGSTPSEEPTLPN